MSSEVHHRTAQGGEPLSVSVERIMSEADDWRRIQSLDGDTSIIVYLDMKSPHAYIAVRPTLELARDYRIKIDFRPYRLSYTGMGISKSVENDERRPPSAEADRRARMFYTTARYYTRQQGIPLRSPYRLLNAEFAHRAFLFAKRQNLEIPFFMSVCLRGWGSGWREYEIESLTSLKSTLEALDADVRGFEEFVAPDGPAERELSAYKEEAQATGFVGVPHYVFDDLENGRRIGLFGREHLALLRSKLEAQGLARDDAVQSEFSHMWRGPRC